jgi:hypothetical protein
MNQAKKSNLYKTIFTHSAYIATLCGLGYFISLIILNLAGWELTDGVNWVFRIAIVIAVIWSIIGLRIRMPKKVGFLQFFSTGIITSVILGLYMALSAFIFYNFVTPDYHPRFEAYYKAKRELQMYNSQLKKKQDDLDDTTYRLNGEDSSIVNSGLEKHMEGTHFFFSTNGQIAINLIFSLVWGIAITLSVTLMMPKKGE